MIYPLGPSGGPYQLMARHFDGTSWGAPVPVSESGDPIFPDVSENPVSGELTALWVDNRTPNKWTIARSTNGGLTWSTPTPIVTGNDADNQFNLQVSAGPDSKGFAVSDGQSNGNIKAAPLTPVGSPGGTPAPVDSVVVGGVQVTLIAPTTCITPPEKVTLRVTSKTKKKLSPTKRVRITLAVFSLDTKKVKDKKSAFKGAFATTGFVPGSAHPAKATVTLKPIKGKAKAKKKTLKGNVTICG
jgi:hypothetical protein